MSITYDASSYLMLPRVLEISLSIAYPSDYYIIIIAKIIIILATNNVTTEKLLITAG